MYIAPFYLFILAEVWLLLVIVLIFFIRRTKVVSLLIEVREHQKQQTTSTPPPQSIAEQKPVKPQSLSQQLQARLLSLKGELQELPPGDELTQAYFNVRIIGLNLEAQISQGQAHSPPLMADHLKALQAWVQPPESAAPAIPVDINRQIAELQEKIGNLEQYRSLYYQLQSQYQDAEEQLAKLDTIETLQLPISDETINEKQQALDQQQQTLFEQMESIDQLRQQLLQSEAEPLAQLEEYEQLIQGYETLTTLHQAQGQTLTELMELYGRRCDYLQTSLSQQDDSDG